MMKTPRRMFACSLLLTLVGCGQPQEVPPPSTSELGSALPRPADVGRGDAECAEPVRIEDERGDEPSLAAWVQVADSIFVGTVETTGRVESPIHLQRDGKDLGAVDVSACQSVNHAMTVTFRDVEVLHGEGLPASFSIQMGALYADEYPGVYVNESGQLHDVYGSLVYPPGARVGAALFKDSAGGYHWRYRQFEVVDGVVYLQELDDTDRRVCSTVPTVTQIPNEFEGVQFDALKVAITGAGAVALSDEEMFSISERHGYPSVIESAYFKENSRTICFGPRNDAEEDPTVPDDPDANQNNRDESP